MKRSRGSGGVAEREHVHVATRPDALDRVPDVAANARRLVEHDEHVAVEALKSHALIRREADRVVPGPSRSSVLFGVGYAIRLRAISLWISSHSNCSTCVHVGAVVIAMPSGKRVIHQSTLIAAVSVLPLL